MSVATATLSADTTVQGMGSAMSRRKTQAPRSGAAPVAMIPITLARTVTTIAHLPTTAHAAVLDATRSAQSATRVG